MTVASPALRYWVDMTLECVRRDHTTTISVGDQRGPFLSARALGMALAALHDARAIATGQQPFLSAVAAPNLAEADGEIAGAAACHQLLRQRYPKQGPLLDAAWSNWRELFPAPDPANASEIAGRIFGFGVHLLGLNDPVHAAMNQYAPSNPPQPYEHRAPPHEPDQGYAGGTWGKANRLVLGALQPNFPQPPPRPGDALSEAHYIQDYDHVVAKGISERSQGTRSLQEEIEGIYWAYDGPEELGTPPRLYMQVVLTILDAIEFRGVNRLSVNDELRIVAGAGIALAEAGIDAWHYKYAPTHMMWRPVIGIPEAATALGVPVPGWLPLGRPETNGMQLHLTPNFPAYPSGHATFGAAALHLLRLFLVEKKLAKFDDNGLDNLDFDFVSDEYDGRNTDPRTGLPREYLTRRHPTIWSAIIENSLSRVYLGVHWQFDGVTKRNGADDEFGVPDNPSDLGHTGGVWLGAQIAKKIAVMPPLGISQDTIDASRIA